MATFRVKLRKKVSLPITLKYLTFILFLLSFSSQSEDDMRIPSLGKNITIDYINTGGVRPISAFFISETKIKFSVIADDGKFWFNDKFEVNCLEANYLLPYLNTINNNNLNEVGKFTINTMLTNLNHYITKCMPQK